MATNRVDGSFDPPAVGVVPGGASLVRFKAKTTGVVFRRATRTLDFEVEAEQQGHDPAIGAMSVVQPPTIPGSGIVRTLTVTALVAAAAAWFGVVRPELRDTVNERVDARIAELSPVDPGHHHSIRQRHRADPSSLVRRSQRASIHSTRCRCRAHRNRRCLVDNSRWRDIRPHRYPCRELVERVGHCHVADQRRDCVSVVAVEHSRSIVRAEHHPDPPTTRRQHHLLGALRRCRRCVVEVIVHHSDQHRRAHPPCSGRLNQSF
jgi:hypothetical protein